MVIVLSNGYLVSNSKDRSIKIWNTGTGECLETLYDKENKEGHKVITLKNNKIAATSMTHNKTKIWNVQTGERVNILSGHAGPIESITLMKNGYIATGSSDHSIKIWNEETGSCVKTLHAHNGSIRSLISFGDNYLVSGSNFAIKIWNVNVMKPLIDIKRRIKKEVRYRERVRSLAYLPSGFLMVGRQDGTIRIWKIFTGELLGLFLMLIKVLSF